MLGAELVTQRYVARPSTPWPQKRAHKEIESTEAKFIFIILTVCNCVLHKNKTDVIS